MKQVILDGSAITTRTQFHDAVAQQLQLPEWYGRNLDALHDCLTAICGETRITFLHFPALPFRSVGLLNVLRDSEEENDKLEISLVTN